MATLISTFIIILFLNIILYLSFHPKLKNFNRFFHKKIFFIFFYNDKMQLIKKYQLHPFKEKVYTYWHSSKIVNTLINMGKVCVICLEPKKEVQQRIPSMCKSCEKVYSKLNNKYENDLDQEMLNTFKKN